ncbi:MAG: thymidine phosphorylase, partial [Bacillota bacterium]
GHTGGTVDKLESIPGFRTGLSRDEFIRTIQSTGVGITGQSANLTPADKKLYALRDVTGTVDQVGLIASSIMSKKIAAGADAIVLDVKVGSGAFLDGFEQAMELAQVMVKIGSGAGRQTVAVISDMSQPLGHAVGNSIEVIEAIEVLSGTRGGRLLELCLTLGSQMLILAHQARSAEHARSLLQEAIATGAALKKLRQLVAAQGGDVTVVDQPQLFPQSRYHHPITALRSGWIGEMDCRLIGHAAMIAGAGRQTKDDIIDLAVGITMHKELGEKVELGEPIATLHFNRLGCRETVEQLLHKAVRIVDQPTAAPRLIRAIVSEHGTIEL